MSQISNNPKILPPNVGINSETANSTDNNPAPPLKAPKGLGNTVTAENMTDTTAPKNNFAPNLPNYTGETQSLKAQSLNAAPRITAAMSSNPFDTDNQYMSPAAAFAAVLDILEKSQGGASEFKNIAGKLSYEEQAESAKATIDQINGQRKDAATQLAGAIVGALCAIFMTGAGFKLANDPDNMARGNALIMGGNIANDLITKFFQTGSSLASTGGQHEADNAKIKQAYDDMMSKLMDSTNSTFKDAYSQLTQSINGLFSTQQSLASAKYETASKVASNIGS